MARHRLLAQLDACNTLLARLNVAVPDALAIVQGRLSAIDGFAAGAGDNRGTSSSTTVESAMLQRENLHDALDMLRLHLVFINDHAATALAEYGDLVGRPNATGTDRCNGGSGMAGAIDWGRPDCEELAASYQRVDGGWQPRYDGLCIACYHRRRRWRQSRAA